jgi:hypothetical protein
MFILLLTLNFVIGYQFNMAIPFPSEKACIESVPGIMATQEIPVQVSAAECITAEQFKQMVEGKPV